jgi:hypothetical protein
MLDAYIISLYPIPYPYCISTYRSKLSLNFSFQWGWDSVIGKHSGKMGGEGNIHGHLNFSKATVKLFLSVCLWGSLYCLQFCPSVCLSVFFCLSFCLTLCMAICLCVCLCVCLLLVSLNEYSNCQYVYMSVDLSVSLRSINIFICMSVMRLWSVCGLSVCLSVFLPVFCISMFVIVYISAPDGVVGKG